MFDEIYSENFRRLTRWCQTLTKDRAAAEDLAQESLLRAMGDWERLDGLNAAAQWAWLRRTAKNLYIDRYRRERNLPGEPKPDGAEDDYSELFVRERLSCLNPEECALVSLRYLEGYNSRELGEMFGLSPGAVRARLAAARARLRQNEIISRQEDF